MAEFVLISAQRHMAHCAGSGSHPPAVRQIMDFLTQVESNRQATHRGCDALSRHGLIAP